MLDRDEALTAVFDVDRVNKFIREVQFVKRDQYGRIPFGYKLSKDNKTILEVIPHQILALHQGIVRMHRGESARVAARWISNKTGRDISPSALTNYYRKFEQKMYKVMVKNAVAIAREIEGKLIADYIPPLSIRPGRNAPATHQKSASIERRFRHDARADESGQEDDGSNN